MKADAVTPRTTSPGTTCRLVVLLAWACASTPAPVPTGHGPPWVEVFEVSGFRIAVDTDHVVQGPEGGVLLWFITSHSRPQQVGTTRFDRGRLRLLVRCVPLGFRSVSQELALGDGPPIHRETWTWSGRDAPPWRVPAAGSTDDQFLQHACALLHRTSTS